MNSICARWRLLAVLAVCLILAGCGSIFKNGADEIDSIAITPGSKVNLVIVDPQNPPQVAFTAIGRRESGSEENYTYRAGWESEYPEIADFDGNVLTAKQAGTTRVRAYGPYVYSPWTTVEIADP